MRRDSPTRMCISGNTGQTYKESMVSGCAAAASGGYTNVLIMPNTVPAMDGETLNDPEAPGAGR